MDGGGKIGLFLATKGVKFLFTLCGGHISPILIGCKQAGIQVIDVRHEATAVFAADAMARLTGIPGVAAVTAGPGLTNSITALKNAQIAQTPLILFAGSVATVLKGRGALQDIDQLALVDPIVKWSVKLQSDCDFDVILEKAFQIALEGTPGPVYVECPIDVLYDESLVREMYFSKSHQNSQKSLVSQVTDWYLEHHLEGLFACEDDDLKLPSNEQIDIDYNSTNIPNPDQKKLSKIAQLLIKAERPVIIAGSQLTINPEKIPDIISALSLMHLPLFLSGMSRGLIDSSSGFVFRHKRSKALRDADVILLIGVPMDFRLNYGRDLNPSAKIISINRNADDLKRNRNPDFAILGDPASNIIKLSQNFESPDWSNWVQVLQENESVRELEINTLCEQATEYVNPLYLCKQIETILPSNAILIVDGGDFVASASYIIHPRQPLGWLDPGPYGTLGVGAGFALAAKLCHPENEVWLLYGDGAAGYSLMEYDTFVRHHIPIIGLIGNDASWNEIARDQVELLHDDVGTVLQYSNYHQIADSLGAKGFLVEHIEDMDSVLKEAQKLAQDGTPVLINCLIGKTDFRKGSISM